MTAPSPTLTADVAPQASHADQASSLPPGADAVEPMHCLYFLVSAATTGPEADTFKLGISSRLEARHRTHTTNWAGFDLARSALVWVSSRRQALDIETSLQRACSNADAEAAAKSKGQPLSSADFVALKSARRYPGRQADGWTEFFGVEYLEKMLEAAEYLRLLNGHQVPGAGVQRGITLRARAVAAKRTSRPPTCAPSKPSQWHADYRKKREQEDQEAFQRSALKATRLLKLALSYEAHVVWVDLRGWRYVRDRPELQHYTTNFSLADVYFGDFAPEWAPVPAKPALPPLTRPRFLKRAAAIADWTLTEEPDSWLQERDGAMCCLEPTAIFGGSSPAPHPACLGTSCLRLEPWPCAGIMSFLEQFEALARRVAGRYGDVQRDFGW